MCHHVAVPDPTAASHIRCSSVSTTCNRCISQRGETCTPCRAALKCSGVWPNPHASAWQRRIAMERRRDAHDDLELEVRRNAIDTARCQQTAIPPEEPQPDVDFVRAARRLHRAVSRGVALGLIIRGGTHAATALAALFRPAKPGQAPHPGVRVLDALRWGAFLGSFGGVYVGVDEAIRKLAGAERYGGNGTPLATLSATHHNVAHSTACMSRNMELTRR